MQSREDICKIEYDKALELIDTGTSPDHCRAQNILMHLEGFSYIPAIMFCAHMYEATEGAIDICTA